MLRLISADKAETGSWSRSWMTTTTWRCCGQNAPLNDAPSTASAITNLCLYWPLWRQFSSHRLPLDLLLYSET
jgi:hypothetical protein